MTFNWNDDLVAFVNEFTDAGDTMLLGRKMTKEFTNYGENVVNNQLESPEFEFANKMVDILKIVFSKTQKTITGKKCNGRKW